MEEALNIVQEGHDQGIEFRLLGSIACRLHCPEFGYFLEHMKRELTDIDFVVFSKQKKKIEEFLKSKGYEIDRSFAVGTMPLTGSDERQIYHNHNSGIHIDIFLDKLNFCHPIYLKKRLLIDFPTIPLPDLFLEKMQIVEINEKDILDLIVLLLEHRIARSRDTDVLDIEYICSLLNSDWGFYYTFSLNLDRLTNYMKKNDILTKGKKKEVIEKIELLRKAVEDAPKKLKWKLRSLVGPRILWYQEVGEVE